MEFFLSEGNQEEMNMNLNLMAQKQNEEHGATGSLPSEVSMEMVYKELHTMKLLLHKIIDNQEVNYNELNDLKVTCNGLVTSVKILEEREHGSGVSTQPMQSDPNPTEQFRSTPHNLKGKNVVNYEDEVETHTTGLPSVDAVMDVDVSNNEGSWSQTTAIAGEAIRPFIPSVWLHEGVTPSVPTEGITIPRSDFRRGKAGMLSPVAKTPTKPKRLFHSQSPPASGKGKSSNKKEKKKSGEGSSKKARNIGLLIPKGKTLHFRPTGDMDLTDLEVQVCAYLFQKTKEPKLIEERLVKAGELSANRDELMSLLPTKVISELVITLMAENIREAQRHKTSQAVWCLPPSFEVDYQKNMPEVRISQKYCARWMPPYPHLKFIYVPIRTSMGHWYLMIIHIEEKTIYHLDSNCPIIVGEFRKQKIEKLATLLSQIVLDENYSSAFRNKEMNFQNFKIMEGYGIPCTFDSVNSGVWLMDWMCMEHFFRPDVLIGILKENEVRMKSAATLLLGPHNELRSLVEENTAEWIDGPPAAPVDQPINLSD